ncbi:MAG: hypothetical protein WCB26_19300, partial [Pseudolabrys sp.]
AVPSIGEAEDCRGTGWWRVALPAREAKAFVTAVVAVRSSDPAASLVMECHIGGVPFVKP